MFMCSRSGTTLPYTLVCDYVIHCQDGSDEDRCVFPPCDIATWTCRNHQCVDRHLLCDGPPDCGDGADEVREEGKGSCCKSKVGEVNPPPVK
jgi:hypothetical protein